MYGVQRKDQQHMRDDEAGKRRMEVADGFECRISGDKHIP